MNYLICGFSGAGKTSLLEKIKNDSQYNDYQFFDLDTELKKEFGKDSITEVIEEFGWEEFRQKEQAKLTELLNRDKVWIALGGGSLNETNADALLQSDSVKVYFLDTPLDECIARIKVAGDRPLLSEGEDFLRKLYAQRLPIYSKFERILSI